MEHLRHVAYHCGDEPYQPHDRARTSLSSRKTQTHDNILTPNPSLDQNASSVQHLSLKQNYTKRATSLSSRNVRDYNTNSSKTGAEALSASPAEGRQSGSGHVQVSQTSMDYPSVPSNRAESGEAQNTSSKSSNNSSFKTNSSSILADIEGARAALRVHSEMRRETTMQSQSTYTSSPDQHLGVGAYQIPSPSVIRLNTGDEDNGGTFSFQDTILDISKINRQDSDNGMIKRQDCLSSAPYQLNPEPEGQPALAQPPPPTGGFFGCCFFSPQPPQTPGHTSRLSVQDEMKGRQMLSLTMDNDPSDQDFPSPPGSPGASPRNYSGNGNVDRNTSGFRSNLSIQSLSRTSTAFSTSYGNINRTTSGLNRSTSGFSSRSNTYLNSQQTGLGLTLASGTLRLDTGTGLGLDQSDDNMSPIRSLDSLGWLGLQNSTRSNLVSKFTSSKRCIWETPGDKYKYEASRRDVYSITDLYDL